MPAAEDAVEIAPVQVLLVEHRPLIGQGHRLRREALLHPVSDVAALRLHHLPLGQVEGLHIGGGLLLPLRPFFQVRGGAGLVKNAQLRPVVALLFDLPQGGTAALAPAALGPLHTVAHQQVDHVGGQAQIVIQPRQDLQVWGAELFAQLLLHLGQQKAEALVVLEQGGDVVGGVNRPILRRGGDGRGGGTGQQAQLLEHLLRRVDTQTADGQGLFQLLRRDAPAKALERQVEKRRVALAALQQLVQRIGGAGRYSVVRPAGYSRPWRRLLVLFDPILHEKPLFVKRGFLQISGFRQNSLFSGENCAIMDDE